MTKTTPETAEREIKQSSDSAHNGRETYSRKKKSEKQPAYFSKLSREGLRNLLGFDPEGVLLERKEVARILKPCFNGTDLESVAREEKLYEALEMNKWPKYLRYRENNFKRLLTALAANGTNKSES